MPIIRQLLKTFLISLGVAGFGEIVSRFPSIETVARYGGALFLTLYALKSFYSSFTQTHVLNPADEAPESVLKIILMCLAFTWLNPHVYLDTVVLIGAISTKYETTKLQFGLGAVTASFMFFFLLGLEQNYFIFWRPVEMRLPHLLQIKTSG